MLNVQPIPAFNDNYIWFLVDDPSRQAYVVDPGDAGPVIDTLETLRLDLAGILVTHHHFDHVGGLGVLCEKYHPVVYGPRNPGIDGITRHVGAGDTVEVLGTAFGVLEVPGHTLDHIAYVHRGAAPMVFCGDTLFAGGCGRLFEGTPDMMLRSLQSLAALDPATRVYCAHEYTLSNLTFAQAVEPHNSRLAERMAHARGLRQRGMPTVPSDIASELATNPFLRCNVDTLRASLRQQGRYPGDDPVQIFASVRGWKDVF